VLNAGVSGFSSAEELLFLERELLKYDPDIVVVSFFVNDLTDNLRTGLFRITDDQLEAVAPTYVPAGRLGNFLNRSWFFNLLSERSNAFAFIKERATLVLKAEIVRANESNLRRDQQSAEQKVTRSAVPDERTIERELADAIFQRMCVTLRDRGIPLVIQSIPTAVEGDLVESFLGGDFDVKQPGVHFLSMIDELMPYLGKEQLYRQRSHFHWTPFAHDRSGRALAKLMVEKGLLDPVRTPVQAGEQIEFTEHGDRNQGKHPTP